MCRFTNKSIFISVIALLFLSGIIYGTIQVSEAQNQEGKRLGEFSPQGPTSDCSPYCHKEAERLASLCRTEFENCLHRNQGNTISCEQSNKKCTEQVSEWYYKCLDLCGKNVIRPLK